MTQYERMVNGLIYDPANDEIMKEQVMFQDLLWAFNQLTPSEYDKKQKYKACTLKDSSKTYSYSPVYCTAGCYQIEQVSLEKASIYAGLRAF